MIKQCARSPALRNMKLSVEFLPSCLPVLLLLLCSTKAFAADPLTVVGAEQAHVNLNAPYGGLPPAPGVANVQVFRASRAAARITDQKGWTYHHHVDLGCWKGRLYLAWDSCETD